MTTPTLEATKIPEAIPDDVMKAAREAAAKVWGTDTGSEELAAEFRRGMRDDSGSIQTAVVAILAERERSQWQPIETAPKDGTHIDLCQLYGGDMERVTGAWWCVRRNLWRVWGSNEFERPGETNVAIYPDHWMPIPASPKGGDHHG